MDIITATANNDADSVKKFLDSGVDVNTINQEKWTSLHIACRNHYIEIVKLLLAHPEIDVNIQNNLGRTPLFIACKYKYFETVKLLLAHPEIDVNVQDENGDTVLHTLLTKRNYFNMGEDNIDIISNLILPNPKVNINLRNNANVSIISLCLDNKYYDLFKKIVNHPKLKINKKDDSLLDRAIIQLDDIETISLLVNKFQLTKIRKDILFVLLRNKYDSVMFKYILNTPALKNQVNINIKNEENDSILHLLSASSSSENTILLKLVLDIPNINVNILNGYGESALLIACKNNIMENIELLLNHPDIKINFNYNDPDNYIEDLTILGESPNPNIFKIRKLLKSHKNYIKSVNNILDTVEE